MATHTLIQALQNPALYDHPVNGFELIETHISWVILTGQYVYKIKKPVDFEVLNFSTLEKRQYCCEEEVRLNKLLAPDVYETVVPITGTETQPQLNGTGNIIEYAIKMREFAQSEIFTQVLANGALTSALIDQLAKVIAEFHGRTPVAASDTVYGTPEHAHFPVQQNFTQILPWLTLESDKTKLLHLQQWAQTFFEQHHTLLAERKKQGFIRDCHGDIHLGNIILHHGQPVLFDRIEFNLDLRWTDVIADIAFLVMDLQEKQQPELANRLINTYLMYTGDYSGLALLPYYIAYRAMVRAKVSLFHANHAETPALQQDLKRQYDQFIKLAEASLSLTPAALFITHGLAGSGKSTVARLLVEKTGAIQISSDIERKRLFNLPLNAQTKAELNQGIYQPAATEQTYAKLLQLARYLIKAGYTVVVDATFLKKTQRALFADLAAELQAPFTILHCQAKRELVENWLQQRVDGEHEASEAGVAVLNMQESAVEGLSEQEKYSIITVDTSNINAEQLIQQLTSLQPIAQIA